MLYYTTVAIRVVSICHEASRTGTVPDFYIHKRVNINEIQFRFVPGRGTTDAVFTVRQLQACCEHHQYCRTALSIMPLRVLSTVGRGSHHGPHHQTSLNPTPDHHPHLFAQQFACSTSNALICSFHARWLRTALSPTSNIL